jgi:hypothetical protein
MAISNELLASTLYSIRDSEVDELFQKVAFLEAAKKRGGIEYEDGGIKITRPLALTEHSSITQLSTGYEPVSLAVSDILQQASFEWCDFTAPIVISQKEELENSGEKAQVRILEARMKSVMGTLRREANKQILANSSSRLSSLSTLNGGTVNAASTGSATGFLEEDALGSQANIIGGVSKATYSTTPGWQNQRETASGAFGTNGLVAMNNLWVKTTSRAPQGAVNCIIASESGFANYKRALFAQERYVDEKALDGGHMVLSFAGAPVYMDIDMPATAYWDGAAAKPYTMYFLNLDLIKLVIHSDADFKLGEFSSIPGTTTRGALLYTKLQLIVDHLGAQGVLYNGDAY